MTDLAIESTASYSLATLFETLGRGLPDHGSICHALFAPAFDAETLLTLRHADSGSELLCTTFEVSLWLTLAQFEADEPPLKQRLLAKHRGIPLPGPRLPPIHRSSSHLRSEQARDLVAAASRWGARATSITMCEAGHATADGIQLLGVVCPDAARPAERRFEVEFWREETDACRFFRALHTLAASSLEDDVAEKRLGMISPYLVD